MKKKLIITAVLASLCTSAAYANIEKAEFSGGRLTISGSTQDAAALPNTVTVRLFKPEKSAEDADYKNNLQIIDYVQTNAGKYNISYTPVNYENGNYKLYITDSEGNTDVKYVMLLQDGEAQSLLNDLNSAGTAEQMKTVFANHPYFLKGVGTIDEIKAAYPQKDLESAISEKIKGMTFQSADEALDEAIKAAVVSALEFAESESDISSLLEKYKDELGFAQSGIYKELYLPNKTKEEKKLLNKGFGSFKEFVSYFNDTVILDNINDVEITKNYNDVMKVINASGEWLSGINRSGYDALSDNVKKVYVQKQVAEKRPYADTAALVTSFNTAVAAAPLYSDNSGGTSTGGGGGNGGGGGGSSSSSSSGNTSMVSIQQDVQKPVFSDLESVKWAEDSILELYKKGIVSGIDSENFNPNGLVTREQFAKMIVTAFGLYNENAACSFDDVADGVWYKSFVASAVEAGAVHGISDRIFGSGQNITREDMAVIAYRAAVKSGKSFLESDELFADDEAISDYAKDAVNALRASGIMSGKGNGRFEPKAFATRAEAAKMIHTLISK